jgi:hypothetical protein
VAAPDRTPLRRRRRLAAHTPEGSLRQAGFIQVDIMLGPGTVEAFDGMAPVLELLRAD